MTSLPLSAALPDLPVRQALPRVEAAAVQGEAVILEAPPGTGKTTLVPLVLADRLDGRVLVAEPRRVAARAAARRMAALSGTGLGEAVGYTVRGDSRVGRDTRVEVVTTGVLVRRLRRDPELAGVAAVMVDECHERHLDTDLACAFLIDVRRYLRPDLPVIAASATARTGELAELFGPRTAVATAEAPIHPLRTVWAPPSRPFAPSHGLRVDPRLLDHVAATVRRAMSETEGDVLVFLPGIGEINAVRGRLSDVDDVLALHGGQDASRQDAALRPGEKRRVILSTDVAESSLTVPGVRVVVDAGLSRQPRTDHSRGLGSLVTVRVSRDAARQRAGRAAREAPGVVYRCWSKAEDDRLPPHAPPEIATADLTSFVLQQAAWGDARGSDLALPDPPPPTVLDGAVSTLQDLGALDDNERITSRGTAIAELGAHPRLARALLDGAAHIGTERAAELVAVLSSDSPGTGDDLARRWNRLNAGADRAATAAWRAETKRLLAGLRRTSRSDTSDVNTAASVPRGDDVEAAAAWITGLAFPERIARLRAGTEGSYLMASGTAAELDVSSGLRGCGWLAIAAADRQPGSTTARVRLAVPCDPDIAQAVAEPLARTERDVGWDGEDIRAVRADRLGAITLSQRPVNPEPQELASAWHGALRSEGLSLLPFTDAATRVRQRIAFCRTHFGDPWPDMDDEALIARAADWLELSTVRRRSELNSLDLAAALRRMLPWPQAGELDVLAPDTVKIPSGSSRAVDYSDPRHPAVAAKLQEFFGATKTPSIAKGRVPLRLRLLSPAGRPAAVTSDLESFWGEGYRQVRAELRGRYPKHPWPDDPTSAEPTAGTKRRR